MAESKFFSIGDDQVPAVDPDLSDRNIRRFDAVPSPADLIKEVPLSKRAKSAVADGRASIRAAMAGSDRRLLVIVGPCSVHDPVAALEYANRLARLRREVDDELVLIMRVYFEKPRTTVGWKGLINDPRVDGSEDIVLGLRTARQVLLGVSEMGIPAASEFLDPIVPQYIADLVSWVAIGARTTESQTHREMASGLSMPVGFKNSTDGNVRAAVNAMTAAKSPHSFFGIDQHGRLSIVRTRGNADVHVVLRGGEGGPNYSPADIEATARVLLPNGPRRDILVDCSHANSGKNFSKQGEVLDSVLAHSARPDSRLLGVMIESNLLPGSQPLTQVLRYGVSITDGCIGWDETEGRLRSAADLLRRRRV